VPAARMLQHRRTKKVDKRSPRTWLISCEEFWELRHSAFLSQRACAEYLGVGLRTVQLWDKGKNRVPWPVVRLLRIIRLGDLGALDPTWTGWTINRNGLWSPTGKKYDPDGMAKWWLVSEQARFFRDAYDRGLFGGVGAPAPAVACAAVPLIEGDTQAEAIRVAVRVILDALPPRPLAFLEGKASEG
jgi:DNA-binding transcriptional regulator YiaG